MFVDVKINFRIIPGMLMDMAHNISHDPRDPIQILFVISLIRDDIPWLYELGLEAYRAIKAGDIKEAKRAQKNFMRAADMFMHGPYMEEISDKETFLYIREAFSMIRFNLEKYNQRPVDKETLEMLVGDKISSN